MVLSSEVGEGPAGQALPFEVGIRMSGDFQLPDRESAIVTFDMGALSMRMEIVSVDGDVYIRDPLSGEWSLDPGGDTVPGGMAGALLSGLPEDGGPPGSALLVSRDTLDGDPVYRLSGEAGTGLLAGMSRGDVLPAGSASVSYWVGTGDFLVRRVLLELGAAHALPDGSSMPVSSRVDVRFSEYGKDVNIRAPALPGVAPAPSPERAPSG